MPVDVPNFAQINQTVSNICDAQDRIAHARSLIDLIGMAYRVKPDADGLAVGAGVLCALDALEDAENLLRAAAVMP